MTDPDNTLEQLAELKPSEASLQRGSERALTAIHSSETSSYRFARPQLRRWIMRSSLAAAVLMAVTLGVLMFTSTPTRSYAQELRDIAAAQEKFAGWIVQKMDIAAVELPEEMAVFTPEAVVLYQQSSTGRYLRDTTVNGQRVVEFMDPVAGTVTRYNSESTQIITGPMDTDLARTLQASSENQAPTTFPELIAFYEKLFGIDAIPVERTEEDQRVRYDITLTEAQQQAMQAKNSVPMTRATVWVDPQTQRVVRMSSDVKGQGSFAMDISYRPAEAIQSVYDIGVPRDAEVIDRTPKADVNDLLDELDRRFEAGLGDVAAVFTETYGEERDSSRELGSLTLLVHRGEDWLALKYLVAVDPTDSLNHKIQAPEGWPRPSVAQAFTAMRDITPYRYVVVVDGHGWQGEIAVRRDNNPIDIRNVLEGKFTQIIPRFRQDESLAGLLWPSRKSLIGFNPDTKLESLEDAANPGWIGLRRTWSDRSDPQFGGNEGVETYWFDPKHDYLTVSQESSWVSFDPDAEEGEEMPTTRRLTTDLIPLADGQWAPVYWGTKVGDGARHFELVVDPEFEVDPSWFADPLERLGLDAPEKPYP
ncbi:MAG: hypothetical protein AAGA25_10340 [Planctomycetota bacterium]